MIRLPWGRQRGERGGGWGRRRAAEGDEPGRYSSDSSGLGRKQLNSIRSGSQVFLMKAESGSSLFTLDELIQRLQDAKGGNFV